METDYYDSLATELSVVQKVSLAVSTSQEYWFVAERVAPFFNDQTQNNLPFNILNLNCI